MRVVFASVRALLGLLLSGGVSRSRGGSRGEILPAYLVRELAVASTMLASTRLLAVGVGLLVLGLVASSGAPLTLLALVALFPLLSWLLMSALPRVTRDPRGTRLHALGLSVDLGTVPVHVEVTPARRGKWYRLRLPDSYREPPLCFFVPSLPDS